MTLPAPRLDDRTFQDLVDEAKTYVQQRCPGWTDHNVSDPGVTLLESFAWMTEMLLYRLNRVPDRLHLRFLELLGVTLFPPTPAGTEVTVRLSSHQATELVIPAGTAVATRRTVHHDAVGFMTTADLPIPPARSNTVARRTHTGVWSDITAQLRSRDRPMAIFSVEPSVDDAMYVGLDLPAPKALLLIQVLCVRTTGHGIDPRTPPLLWEAWTPLGWRTCDVQRDDTDGFNVSGGVELHLPPGHTHSVEAGTTAAWVRCRVVSGPRMYRTSPEVTSVSAATVGGDVDAVAAELVPGEVLGVSDGTAGQRFQVSRPPVLPDTAGPLTVRVRGGSGGPDGPRRSDVTGQGAGSGSARDPEQTWTVVPDFSGSGPTSRHVVLDRSTGELSTGPAVRLEDGSVRHYGAVPQRGAEVCIDGYRTGGGAKGNVAAGTVTVLRTSIPYVARVYNRAPATGGVDGETVAEARVRGPLELRRGARVVTAEDYVALTRQVAPEFARVHAVAVPQEPGAVRVLVVPAAVTRQGRLVLRDLQLPEAARERVTVALEAARVVGTRVNVEPPSYVGIRVEATVRAGADVDPDAVVRNTTRALDEYLNPLRGGPDGEGWPFGRPVQAGEVHGVLSHVVGVDVVEEVLLRRASPVDDSVSEPQERIELAPTHLVLSVGHVVTVVAR